jgi:hypothetical protein
MAIPNGTKVSGQKRKRDAPTAAHPAINGNAKEELKTLEQRICESPKHLNDILKVIKLAYPSGKPEGSNASAVTSLCRIFYRCLMKGWFRENAEEEEPERLVRAWFQSRLDQYVGLLLAEMSSKLSVDPLSRLKLIMKLVKADVSARGYAYFSSGIFKKLIQFLLTNDTASETVLDDFLASHALVFDDLRIHTATIARYVVSF